MSFKTAVMLSGVITLSGLAGCAEVSSDEAIPDDELTSTVEQESVGWRNDQTGIITPGAGNWGGWWTRIYCNPGTWAVGYRMRVEGSQGGGDDTSLNSVQLLCKDPWSGATEWISSYDGHWGSWYSSASCAGPGNYLTGARLRFEASQGGGDDTAANDVEFQCTSSSIIHAPGGHTWGSWLGWTSCPAKSAVCGLAIRFEGSQGGGDDTAMNGLELECCDVTCTSDCGDSICDSNCESPQTCPSDCGYCGNGSCSQFESRTTCPQDCGYCGDHVCNGGETAWSCPTDCDWCGNGICTSGEIGWCTLDCGGGGGCDPSATGGDGSNLKLPPPC